jgi:LDH2 family malate/lactate/ureidoglycolate dehydrogenase
LQEAELITIDAAQERALILDVLSALGAGEAAAADQADVLLEGDLRGRSSHGVQRLPVIAERIRQGLIAPRAEPVERWTGEAMLTVDGANGLGPHVAFRAAAAVSERARRTGVAAAAIRRASHLGILAVYVERIAAAGQIGIAFTTSEALVHPWGGRVALVGTNPIAVAMPAGEAPFVLDMAMGAISRGEVIARGLRGEPLPPGAAVDADGRPTTDPGAAAAISPFGGAKGFALGLAIELIVAALTGTAVGDEVRGTLDVTDPVTKGDLLIALDARVDFAARLGRYLDALRASPPAADTSGVTIPGARARAERARRMAEGVPLPAALWRDLQSLREREASARA